MENKYLNYALLLIAIIILTYTFVGLFVNNSPMVFAESHSSDANFETISSGSTERGDVSLDLIPHKIIGGVLTVELSANTHSVSLNQFNLKEITVLEYDGREVFPREAPKLSGHHTEGELVFDIKGEPKSFKITISGIPKKEKRIFEWSKE